jgi:leader peptidase (prepilin peptidase)/N-methyltransferase
VGAAVGSFLNVVIYRLPAGLSIAYPPSHCPACKHAIRWYDNIPIAGWLILRGRCRDCGAKFSSRYAWVELASGLLLLGLTATGPLSQFRSFTAMLDDANAIAAWAAVAHLAVLLATLWTAAMIVRDGHRPPWNLFATPAVVGIAVALIWPELYAVAPLTSLGVPLAKTEKATAWIGMYGLAAGGFAFELVARLAGDSPRRDDGVASLPRETTVVLGGLCGLFLGWQLVLAAAVLASTIRFVDAGVSMSRSTAKTAGRDRRAVHFALAVSVVVFAHRMWPHVPGEAWPEAWPRDRQAWWPLAALLVLLIAAWATRLVSRRDTTRSA